MNQDFYTYLQKLHQFVHYQDSRIKKLEKLAGELQQQLNALKDRPPIQVDTIEYKFDQLKVETLEGTLNIGLNPSELQGIEDFAVKGSNVSVPPAPQGQMQRAVEIEEDIEAFLEKDLPQVYAEAAGGLNLEADSSYLSFIKEDVKKQLPSRIDYYMKQAQNNQQMARNPEGWWKEAASLIKGEIRNGVKAFLGNLPETMKGMKKE
ncbi:spore germination protein GerPC [Bacillus infantis]|uniref:spore germination protein GerPC n=1 Tax=Bacillus infantis TaxID=324767 RepID=UPI003CF7ED57